jgi:two-component system OmpR family response regulator
LHLAEEWVPSVVVVNHVLPDMSGLDLLDRLRGRRATRGIPVVLVSGRVRQLPSGATGADRVLPLPFDIDVLLAHVEQLAGAAGGADA